MKSLLSLPAMVLAAPKYAVWRMRQPGVHIPIENTPSVPPPSVDIAPVPWSEGRKTRVMQWITIDKLLSIVTKGSDLVVLDLRANAQFRPLSVPNAFVLAVSPNEMEKVLEWLPGDWIVVFYGASNLSIFMIETSPFMDGSAPLYVLEGHSGLEEIA